MNELVTMIRLSLYSVYGEQSHSVGGGGGEKRHAWKEFPSPTRCVMQSRDQELLSLSLRIQTKGSDFDSNRHGNKFLVARIKKSSLTPLYHDLFGIGQICLSSRISHSSSAFPFRDDTYVDRVPRKSS